METVQPPASWYDLLENSQAAVEAFSTFTDQWGAMGWFGAAVATLSGVLLVASRIPGVYGAVAGVAHRLLAPMTTKEQKKKADVQAESAEKMIVAIQDWREEIEDAAQNPAIQEALDRVGIDTSGLVKSLTKRIDDYTPDEFNALVAAIKDQRKKDPGTYYAPQRLPRLPKPIEKRE